MPKFCRYLIKPDTPFHIGERGVGLEETSISVHSDTLFGAICWSWRLLFGEKDLIELLNLFKEGRPPFLISSTFPFICDIMTLPKPLKGLGGAGLDKKVRRAPLVTQSIFQSLVGGNALLPEEYDIINGDPGNVIATLDEAKKIECIMNRAAEEKEEEIDEEEKEKKNKKCRGSATGTAWTIGESPRVTLDRDTRMSSIYYAGDVRFMEGSGLYFLVDFRDKKYESMFDGALRLLGDEGLGGERSSGRGLFSFDKISDDKIESIGVDGGDDAVLLSLYRPRKEDASTLQSSTYGLITRRGWTAGKSDLRKKSVRMLTEGSMIPFEKDRILGSMENVSGEGTEKRKQIISYGLAFQVPARLGQ